MLINLITGHLENWPRFCSQSFNRNAYVLMSWSLRNSLCFSSVSLSPSLRRLDRVCFIVNRSVFHRNSTLLFHRRLLGFEKKKEDEWFITGHYRDYKPTLLALLFVSLSCVAFVTHIFPYIMFQSTSLTLSVSRNKETHESKQIITLNTTTTLFFEQSISMCAPRILPRRHLTAYFCSTRSCVNVSRSMSAKLVCKLVMHAGSCTA